MDDLHQIVDVLSARLPVYQKAWAEHPDREGHIADSDNPVCMMGFTHEPVRGHKTSFIIAPIGDLLSTRTIAWGEKNLGEFAGIFPISPKVPVLKYRVGRLSWSPKGRGKGYQARQALRALLPRKYHRLITLARKLNRLPKTVHGEGAKGTKTDLHFERFCRENADAVAGLSEWMGLRDFWKCATGNVSPGEVEEKVLYQVDMF